MTANNPQAWRRHIPRVPAQTHSRTRSRRALRRATTRNAGAMILRSTFKRPTACAQVYRRTIVRGGFCSRSYMEFSNFPIKEESSPFLCYPSLRHSFAAIFRHMATKSQICLTIRRRIPRKYCIIFSSLLLLLLLLYTICMKYVKKLLYMSEW